MDLRYSWKRGKEPKQDKFKTALQRFLLNSYSSNKSW
jgi:hypothetical protein